MKVSSWTAGADRPADRQSNRAAQLSTDNDDYRTALTRVGGGGGGIADIDETNYSSIKALFLDKLPPNWATIAS